MLSGGERNRLLLARLFLQPANVLVLDEPTNDLDAETLELLEELVLDYAGTLLLVSHDRAFLDHVVTGTLVFEGEGRITEYTGGYEDWLRQRPPPAAAVAPVEAKAAPPQRAEDKVKFLKREQRELDELPHQIENMEEEVSALNHRLWDPETYKGEPATVPQLKAKLAALETQIKESYLRWEILEHKRKAAMSDPSSPLSNG
jgi:ATP-binding cassette subfamily F protein uup